MEKIVNYHFVDNNTIQFFDINSNIFNKKISELGHPYFYGIPDNNKVFTDVQLNSILKAEQLTLPILTQNGVIQKSVYKLTIDTPKNIYGLLDKFKETFEARIPYVRKLGFDNKIEWADLVERYADIDIEERNGDVELIGYKDSITKEYEPYYSVKDFVDVLKKRKISEIYAWNGQSYDFERLEKLTNDNYYKNILKLDAMFFYSIYNQKPPRTLNLAGKENGVGTKVVITKPFKQLTKQELEIYNEQDVNIQNRILNKLGIRQLAHYYSNYLAMHPNDVYSNENKYNFQLRPSATRAFDSLIIRQYRPRVYLQDVIGVREKIPYEGGFILEPKKGLYRNVASFDYNSLYPHIIMHTDFDNFIYKLIKHFEKEIYNKRLEFKQLYKTTKEEIYNTGQQTLKILINSLYGVFANVYFRYYNSDVAMHITSNARNQIQKLITTIKQYEYPVIYGDTDSVFISDISKKAAEAFTGILNQQLSPFEVKLEKYYPKMLIFGS